jgi:arylsulfate sulfotransferase
VEVLANGDIEYELAGTNGGSQTFEVTNQTTPQTVWNQSLLGSAAYRGYRMPSLYPGVQW